MLIQWNGYNMPSFVEYGSKMATQEDLLTKTLRSSTTEYTSSSSNLLDAERSYMETRSYERSDDNLTNHSYLNLVGTNYS